MCLTKHRDILGEKHITIQQSYRLTSHGVQVLLNVLCFTAVIQQVRQVHKRIRIVRLVTTNDGQRIVGLLIPNSAVESVLTGLFVMFQHSNRMI